MNKAKNVFRIAMSVLLAASVGLSAVGCGDNDDDNNDPDVNPDRYKPAEIYDPETRPLVLSTNAPDKVFNPFFSTSTVDANIISMTQIGLISTDKNGTVVCGENEPCVALDYSVNETKEGTQTYTTYQFVIKNGVKFSDGVELTIKDVLFNLYVYLDPVYTGSATMYSTKIVGLSEYRAQDSSATDTILETLEANFQTEAAERIDDLVEYVYSESRYTANSERPDISWWSEEKLEKAAGDFVTTGELFIEELNSDYNAITASMSSYNETNGFTQPWQVFLVNDANIDLYKHKDDDSLYKDEQGNLIFDPDGENTVLFEEYLEDYLSDYLFTNTDTNSDAYKAEYDEAVKSWAIEYAYNTYFGEDVANTNGADFELVARYWGTASELLSQFTAEAKSAYFAENGGKVKSISGITTAKGSAFKSSSVSTGTSYSDDYDLLQIKIKGVDPKAIYNFGFSVAPLHYYSGIYNGTNYVTSFNEAAGNFGLPTGDINFMNTVIKDSAKNGFPIGAGVYQATNSNGADYSEDNKLTLADFMSNNVIYFKRNENFKTVGSGLKNANIKLLRYQVINSDQIISSLNTGAIDYGEPDATQENLNALGSDILGATALTNGYGYVGINARFIPSIYVRRAIIKAMDTSYITNDYYKGGFAEIIYRSMSTTSWAYPTGATTYVAKDGTSYKYDRSGEDIQALINRAAELGGYTKNSQGIYTNGKDTMSYTFTIAGGSTQHPAYKMFLNAMEILNKCDGINVKVVTSQTALSDLTAGKLQVWAAAWTSTIDPDMYQVYHKDSSAASILNWGYDYIKADKTTYASEWRTITDLSKTIDLARSTTTQSLRASYYKTALDYVMELAVEFPTYQRNDLFAFNKAVLNQYSLQYDKELTPYNGPLGRIWEVNYN